MAICIGIETKFSSSADLLFLDENFLFQRKLMIRQTPVFFVYSRFTNKLRPVDFLDPGLVRLIFTLLGSCLERTVLLSEKDT